MQIPFCVTYIWRAMARIVQLEQVELGLALAFALFVLATIGGGR